MLEKIDILVSVNLIEKALQELPSDDFRYTLNEPIGNFFYDPWKIKEEFKDTVWSNILESLPFPIGEARIIILKSGNAYQVHADIDDIYHLNLQSESSYLIDLTNNELHLLKNDNQWYLMDAGRLHTATNFGRYDRIQLVVRKNLQRNRLLNPIKIKLSFLNYTPDSARFIFDNTVSLWLNSANKRGIINDFSYKNNFITFEIEQTYIDEIKSILVKDFIMEIL